MLSLLWLTFSGRQCTATESGSNSANFSMALGIAFLSTVKVVFLNDSRTEVNLTSVVKILLFMHISQNQTQFRDARSHFSSSIFRETQTP